MSFPISPEKLKILEQKMEELGIKESEIEEKFIKGSGPGGQKVNKTSSAVYLKYEAMQIEIKCQKTRSQSLNRYHARKELLEKVEEKIKGKLSKKQQEIEKIKRQKRKRSKRAKEKVLEDKKKNSEKKKNRSSISEKD